MLLYVDGARLGCALTCRDNDLTIQELATLCDAFYIGGTKNGALFGEALVILNDTMNDHFRWMIKRQCGLLAKGRLIGVQFEALLEGGMDSIYFPWHPMPMNGCSPARLSDRTWCTVLRKLPDKPDFPGSSNCRCERAGKRLFLL